jgi:hypothetical protein
MYQKNIGMIGKSRVCLEAKLYPLRFILMKKCSLRRSQGPTNRTKGPRPDAVICDYKSQLFCRLRQKDHLSPGIWGSK